MHCGCFFTALSFVYCRYPGFGYAVGQKMEAQNILFGICAAVGVDGSTGLFGWNLCCRGRRWRRAVFCLGFGLADIPERIQGNGGFV